MARLPWFKREQEFTKDVALEKKKMYINVFKNKKQNVYGAELTRGSHVETCFHQLSFSGSNSSPIHISARLEEKK